MGKLKTKKTAVNRIKVTKTGKILRKAVSAGHLKRKWSSDKKSRRAGYTQQPNRGHIKIFKRILPKAKIK